jgi:hypothetical protein
MASSVSGTAADLGRKLVNRVETVVGDDWREAKKRTKHAARQFSADYYTPRKPQKPDPRKYPKPRSGGR